PNRPVLLNSIFKGKVKRVVKGMEGVFVDIGLEKDAFLPQKGESLKVGDSVLVQMVREPEDEKGAKLSTNIKLTGKFLIYTPNQKKILCSSRIKREECAKVNQILQNVLENDGALVRSCAKLASEQELIEEFNKLRQIWQETISRVKYLKKPQMVLEELPNYLTLLKEYWNELSEVACDNVNIWHKVSSFLEDFYPQLLKRNSFVKDTHPYFARYDLGNALRSAVSEIIWLKSGGCISIQETKAFTIIDVNSGDPSGDSHEENAVITNLEASQEIVRQILLRDIGGIILIDFIDMKKRESQNRVIAELSMLFKNYRCHANILGFTRLGILEIVRKRTSVSLSQILSENCKVCKGSGKIKRASAYAFEIQTDIKGSSFSELELQVPPERKEETSKAIEKMGFAKVNIVENQDLDINSYNINYV
ncbi:MAG: ribonuclease E/G, partial [Aquificaceae bacterium]|nr:ribonuclease E/G [Aquificaceae bacterium]